MRRREFCHKLALVGGSVVLAPLIKACATEGEATAVPGATATEPRATALPVVQQSPAPSNTPEQQPTSSSHATRAQEQGATAEAEPEATPTLRPTEEQGLARVALVRTGDRAEGVRKALSLLALNPVHGEKVLLKPNYNSADTAPASTHGDIFQALAEELFGMGARSITVGERSGMGNTRAVLQQTGALALSKQLGMETLVFDELAEADWVIRESGDFHWSKGIPVPRALLDSPCVVQTCNLKTHGYGGHFTMSLKNSVGYVARTVGASGHNFMGELHGSQYQRQMIAEINMLYDQALIVMDGVEAFVDGGPAVGKKVRPEVVIAGTDPVAVDAVGVAILRLFGTTAAVSQGRVFEQAQIARAAELGLGVAAPEKIRFVTGDAESAAYAETIRQVLLA